MIRHVQATGWVVHPSITYLSVKPVSYIGTQAALRLPPLVPRFGGAEAPVTELLLKSRVSCWLEYICY